MFPLARVLTPSALRVCACVQVVFPDGVPPEAANVVPANVFGVQVPISAEPEGMETIFVDIYKKTVSDNVSYRKA